MAGSMALAFDQADEHPEFDRRVRLAVDRPEPAPVDRAVAAAWAGIDRRQLEKVIRLIAAASKTNEIDAGDAVGDAILHLLEKDPESFADDPELTLGRVYNYAGKRVARMRRDSLAFRCLSLDMSNDPKSAADPEREGTVTMGELSLAVAYTRAGVDEDAHETPPPAPGEPWSRLQLIGVVQRFRNATGRAPKVKDFGGDGMPDFGAVVKAGFKSLNDLFLEAGVPIETPTRTKHRWGPVDSSEACYSFRRREGYWPSGEDSRDLPAGTLPPRGAMERFYGGTTSLQVQLGVEAILGPIDTPTWTPDGSLTARLRASSDPPPPPQDSDAA